MAQRAMTAVEPIGGLERIVYKIAQGVWRDTGEDFFRSLVRQLSHTLHADFVFVGALQPGGGKIRTLAFHGTDGKIADFEYALSGTPCAGVMEKRVSSYAEGVQRLFPADSRLTEMGAEGYVGAPLTDSTGRCIGLICAITRRPLENPKLAEAVLQIFAERAAAELERKEYEEALAGTERRWHDFVTHSNEAVIHVVLEQPISMDATEDEQIEHFYHHAYVADCNDQAAALFGLAAATGLIGARLEMISPRADTEQIERLRAFVRAGWRFSQVERNFAGRTILMTRDGIVKDGKLWGAWVTGRDISPLKEAEAQVRSLNRELERRVEELSELRARLEQDNAYLREEISADHSIEDMVGSSPRFQELASRIQLVASTSATVLISGETGTGKELVARAIHNLSDRRDRPLVKVNCAAMSPALVESELFGHVRGAFTGATERRVGRFEYANGGTLFLDEVTELPLEIQAKLLRVLQEQEFEPVGSNRTVKVDVRLLAATNRNLADAVREGRFRMDLYYRLLVVPVEVPPLRERREDIPVLAAHFIARYRRQFGRRVDGISPSMMQQLMAYDWPGNVRELENVLARAVVLSPGGVLDAPLLAPGAVPSEAPPRSMEEAERKHIESALESARWVLEGPNGAAAMLGLNPSTLRSRMKRLGIQRPV
jgi:transcriptional regulator with PAS, ATPase and Fis domain